MADFQVRLSHFENDKDKEERILDIFREAFKDTDELKERAQLIKKALDTKEEGMWHVTIGKHYTR